MSDHLFTPRKPLKRYHPAVQALVFGFLVVILLVTSDQVSRQFGLRESQRIVDDVLGGFIAGLLSYLNNRKRQQFIAERLNTVALMNHHVRNALQVIRDAHYIQNKDKVAAMIEDAANRIDWALREVLPGGVKTYDEPWKRGTISHPQDGS